MAKTEKKDVRTRKQIPIEEKIQKAEDMVALYEARLKKAKKELARLKMKQSETAIKDSIADALGAGVDVAAVKEALANLKKK